jgi:ribosomal protein L20
MLRSCGILRRAPRVRAAWIARINAAARLNATYNRLING